MGDTTRPTLINTRKTFKGGGGITPPSHSSILSPFLFLSWSPSSIVFASCHPPLHPPRVSVATHACVVKGSGENVLMAIRRDRRRVGSSHHPPLTPPHCVVEAVHALCLLRQEGTRDRAGTPPRFAVCVCVCIWCVANLYGLPFDKAGVPLSICPSPSTHPFACLLEVGLECGCALCVCMV